MEKKSTASLDEVLKSSDTERIGRLLKENSHSFAQDERPYYEYIKDTVKSKGIQLSRLYMDAGFSQSFGGKLLRGEKNMSNRDMALRFCIGGHFNLDETNRALKLCGYSPLYSKVRRDAVLIVAINTGVYKIDNVNRLLEDNGFERLTNSPE